MIEYCDICHSEMEEISEDIGYLCRMCIWMEAFVCSLDDNAIAALKHTIQYVQSYNLNERISVIKIVDIDIHK